MDITPAIRAPRESAARNFYLAYLNSASWRITRNRALRRAGYQCERCPSKRHLEVHHKCYDRLGHEWDQDLEVVCEDCHEGHHDVERAQRGDSLKIYLKLVGLTMHDPSIVTFSDLAEAVKVRCAQLRIPYDSDRIGRAIGLAAGKQQPNGAVEKPSVLVRSPEPLNKAEALRILFELSEGRPLIHVMPAAASTIDIYGPAPRPDWGEHDLY